MIIDFLTTCASIIKTPIYTSIAPNVLSNNYSIKTAQEIKSWKLSNDNISSTYFIFMSSDVKKLNNIELELGGSSNNSNIVIKIETSIDYINWFELSYKEDSSNQSKAKPLYKIIDGLYYNVRTKTIDKEEDVNVDALTYAYTKYNDYNKEVTFLYDNLEWKFIKISLYNIPQTSNINGVDNTLFFKKLEINIDEEINIDGLETNLLELKSSIFTQAKMFEEYEFYPDIIKNYMKMIEEDNIISNTLNYVNINVNSDPMSTVSLFKGVGYDILGINLVVY